MRSVSPCSTAHTRSHTLLDDQDQQCYHAMKHKTSCTYPRESLSRETDKRETSRDLHTLSNCPVCYKYQCYFPTHYNEDRERSLYRHRETTRNAQQSRSLRHRSSERENSELCCCCRPNSAPSIQDEKHSSV